MMNFWSSMKNLALSIAAIPQMMFRTATISSMIPANSSYPTPSSVSFIDRSHRLHLARTRGADGERSGRGEQWCVLVEEVDARIRGSLELPLHSAEVNDQQIAEWHRL